MTSNTKIWTAVIVLVLLHAVVVFAGFVAPADPTSQNRDFPFVPPSRLHFVDARGHFHLRPFIYAWISKPQGLYEYEESSDREYPLHFLVKGPEYRIAGVFHPASICSAWKGLRRYFLPGPTITAATSFPGFCTVAGSHWPRVCWRLEFRLRWACCSALSPASTAAGSTNR